MDSYLALLKDSLIKKEEILSELIELSLKQSEIVKKDNVDWDEFNKIVDIKADKVDLVLKLDEGFEHVFNKIKENIKGNEQIYSSEIKEIQSLIKFVTEKSTSLQATEMRNKIAIEGAFTKARNEIKQSKLGQKVAIDYYNRMNQINTIDPQLMDTKS